MAKLVVLSEGFTGLTCELKADKTTVGRLEDNAFQITEPSVSSHHCELTRRATDLLVKDLETGKVEITAQNHGFAVDANTLPSDVAVNRLNLNDQTVEGMRHKTKPIFCVQYHPEASPGPHDSTPLFDEFRALVERH